MTAAKARPEGERSSRHSESTTKSLYSAPQSSPFFNDPFFRRFFGPNGNNGNNDDNQDQDQDQDQRPSPRNRGHRHQPPQHSEKSQSLGSGVIVSADGYILTANHVVEGADEIKVAFANGSQEFTAKVIGAARKRGWPCGLPKLSTAPPWRRSTLR